MALGHWGAAIALFAYMISLWATSTAPCPAIILSIPSVLILGCWSTVETVRCAGQRQLNNEARNKSRLSLWLSRQMMALSKWLELLMHAFHVSFPKLFLPLNSSNS